MSGQIAGFGYYPSLTGLRGVAIALVVAYHLGLPVPGGGLVGVTLFFVLSGFLITSLVVAEVERTHRIDLIAFYVRRARRLLPPLLAVVGVFVLLQAAVGVLPSAAGDDLLALTYVSNWARIAGDQMGLWNHTWSLAIEEQFYLLWPAFLILVLKLGGLRSRWLIALVLGAAVTSALLRIALLMAGANGDRIYFGSDTRAEAILLGSAIALLRSHSWVASVPRWIGPVAVAALIALSVVEPSALDLWPAAGYTVVAVTAGAAIVAGLKESRLARILGSLPLTWLGDRSYSLYLWHVPVIMVARAVVPAGTPDVVRASLALAVALGLSAASYVAIERRFRSRRPREQQVRPLPAAGMARADIAA